MNEKTKDPFAHLPRRRLFADGTAVPSGKPICHELRPTPLGVVLMPSDKFDEAADKRFAESGGLRVLSSAEQGAIHEALRKSMVLVHKAKRGRPTRVDGYPGPGCGLSRAQWYRERAKAKSGGLT